MLLTKIRGFRDRYDGSYWIYVLFSFFKKWPLTGLLRFILMFSYSCLISTRLFGFSLVPKVCFPSGMFLIRLYVSPTSIRSMKSGMLIFNRWGSGGDTVISLNSDSVLLINDTFTLGDGCKVQLSQNAKLYIDGGNGSGITCNTILLCEKKIFIGRGVIISWGCYISDSSQHYINGTKKILPVTIGEQVWLSESVSVLPGTKIGSGSVVASKSVVSGVFCRNVLLAGSLATIRANDIYWSR